LWQSLKNRCSPETGELASSRTLQVGSGDGGANCKPSSQLWILEKALSLKLLPQGDSFFVEQRQLLAVLCHLSNWELLSAFLLSEIFTSV
jgi:hypothetical protein